MDGTTLFLLTHTVCCYPSLYEMLTRPKLAAPISTHFTMVVRMQLPGESKATLLEVDGALKEWLDKISNSAKEVMESTKTMRPFRSDNDEAPLGEESGGLNGFSKWVSNKWADKNENDVGDSNVSSNIQTTLETQPPPTESSTHTSGNVLSQTKPSSTITIPQVSLCSPEYTLLSHLFHHEDLEHYLTNAYTLWVSAISMGLGFIDNWVLFLGGGGCGLIGLVMEQTWRMNLRRQSHEKWRRLLPMTRYVAMYGSSGGASGLVGCETWMMLKDLSISVGDVVATQKSSKLRQFQTREEKRKVYSRFWRTFFYTGMRVFWIYSQVKSMQNSEIQNPHPLTSSTPMTAKLAPRNIGYSAHIGGFLFGIFYGICRNFSF